MSRIKFLNTYIDSVTKDEAVEIVESMVQERKSKYVVTPNTDIIVKMQKDEELKKACDSADLILTDGQMLVGISKWLGNSIKERICMTDFIWQICELSIKKEYSIFFFGGREDVLTKGIDKIRMRYSGLKIAGSYSPPLGFEKEEKELGKALGKLKGSGADILIVFLGCPKQEKFIARYKDVYNIPVSITMGGCIDFIGSEIKRAPIWMQRIGMEWFFRFIQEPRRLFKRYFIDDVQIFPLALRHKIKA